MASPSASSSEKTKEETKDEETRFECNICFETAQDAVVSMCGHLYCWPCIHRWMEARQSSPTCPVCKSAIEKEKLIPLYGRGGERQDPREKVPPRPQGQREEVPEGGNVTEGVQFSFGLGLGPLIGMPLFTLQTGGVNRNPHQRPGRRHNRTVLEHQQQSTARILLTLAILFIVMLFLS